MENSYQFARFHDTDDYKRCLRLHERTGVHEEELQIDQYTLQNFCFLTENSKCGLIKKCHTNAMKSTLQRCINKRNITLHVTIQHHLLNVLESKVPSNVFISFDVSLTVHHSVIMSHSPT
jgi:hypothetical protein